jgi:hypothetical protein
MPGAFFHEIDPLQFNAMKALGMTWGEIMTHYRAPDWCEAGPGALEGAAGCWSLVGRLIRCRADCGDCEFALTRIPPGVAA